MESEWDPQRVRQSCGGVGGCRDACGSPFGSLMAGLWRGPLRQSGHTSKRGRFRQSPCSQGNALRLNNTLVDGPLPKGLRVAPLGRQTDCARGAVCKCVFGGVGGKVS